MKITCAHCGKKSNKPTSAVNRAKRDGLRIFCNRKCAGIGRRTNKTKAERKEEKRLYDLQYRQENLAMLRQKKRQYHKATYDPKTAAKARKKTMARHIEYCRQPEYRKWKKKYDQKYRGEKLYGEFGEAFQVLMAIENEIASRITRYEVYQQNGTLNKHLARRRDYERQTGQRQRH